VLRGYDDKPGWLSNVKGKPLLYALLADAVRDGACIVRSTETAAQFTCKNLTRTPPLEQLPRSAFLGQNRLDFVTDIARNHRELGVKAPISGPPGTTWNFNHLHLSIRTTLLCQGFNPDVTLIALVCAGDELRYPIVFLRPGDEFVHDITDVIAPSDGCQVEVKFRSN